MGVIILAVFILGVAFGIALHMAASDDLKEDRDYWEREAKKHCAELGEIRILAAEKQCSRCPHEDTSKCMECNK